MIEYSELYEDIIRTFARERAIQLIRNGETIDVAIIAAIKEVRAKFSSQFETNADIVAREGNCN